jgi:ribosome-associated heat shock protein Hsp15
MTEPLVARTVRLDVWLWAARFYKTRVLAKDAVALGKVEIGGQRAKPARAVRVGDVLQVQRGDERFEVTVLGLSDVRGPAPVAQALYGESEASQQRRAQVRATRAAERSGYRAPQTKPDKRARRLIQALGDIDAL